MEVLPTILLSVHNIIILNTDYAGPLQLKEFSFSYLFLRQALTGILTEQKFISDCRYRVIENSSLVPVLFREVFSHPYISLFHLLVNGLSVTCFRTFF